MAQFQDIGKELLVLIDTCSILAAAINLKVWNKKLPGNPNYMLQLNCRLVINVLGPFDQLPLIVQICIP